MVNQEILNAMNEISKSPMISSVSLSIRDYACPELSIQSHANAPENEVLSLVGNNLGELKQANFRLDFDHCNCWGKSYSGSNNGVEITLITSTTK